MIHAIFRWLGLALDPPPLAPIHPAMDGCPADLTAAHGLEIALDEALTRERACAQMWAGRAERAAYLRDDPATCRAVARQVDHELRAQAIASELVDLRAALTIAQGELAPRSGCRGRAGQQDALARVVAQVREFCGSSPIERDDLADRFARLERGERAAGELARLNSGLGHRPVSGRRP